ncbi:olfactomedin-like protein 2B isoform X2 [Calypte anna]|uniref:olfactomedin-like protein 2B isoform X2 n=1 Tax=Calypte anna TaxID=9244 RepID=UPI0011C3E38E|nr:olfactomedin-like protein 2B isoform X2 [Calypte anna]
MEGGMEERREGEPGREPGPAPPAPSAPHLSEQRRLRGDPGPLRIPPMARPLPLLLCLAALGAGCWAATTPPGTAGPPHTGTAGSPHTGTAGSPHTGTAGPSAEPLQDEADNQENILSQLLGDYDKVKAVSEGSDCRCKCLVRPLGRGACQRINEGAFKAEDFYTVETITSGPSCKCACVAPPSALNPCEGDFRLKKLREAESSDLKLSSIVEMLESAFYGLDLLKLHSVTTKLVGRVEKLEEGMSRNSMQEGHGEGASVEESPEDAQNKLRKNCSNLITNSLADIESSLQRDAEAAYTHTEGKYEERFLKDETISQQINSVESLLSPEEEEKPKQLFQRQLHVRSRPPSKPTIIRGVTYYKAHSTESENDIEEQPDELFSGDTTVDLLIEDQLLRPSSQASESVRKPSPVGWPPTPSSDPQSLPDSDAAVTTTSPVTSLPEPTQLTLAMETPTTPVGLGQEGTLQQPGVASASTVVATSLESLPSATVPSVTVTSAGTSWDTENSSALESSPGAWWQVSTPETLGSSSTPKQSLEEEDIRNIIGRCKDTLSTISGPTTQNTYGRNEGAWMKDPLAREERIYVTNYYYGNTLVEFRNLDNFKQGRWSNSFKLPYSWIGTGHVVYNGSFYYNRAFTRNIIKYDLKQRYVAAWAMLHDVAYEESTPWRWRGHSDVDFAVDENGLWVIYPAISYEGSSQEVIVLSKLNAADLSTQKETTWRTGLRKNFYGNCFVICGVLYAVDSYNKRNANISYAFDTHTNTQIIPRLLFENEYAYTTQIDYNPKDRLLYAWDNGHQVTYHVIFAY